MTDEPLPPDVTEAIAAGRTIDAIKRLRGHWGIGLAEAKEIVDRARADVAEQPSHVPQGAREDNSTGRLLLVLAIIGAAVAGYYLLI